SSIGELNQPRSIGVSLLFGHYCHHRLQLGHYHYHCHHRRSNIITEEQAREAMFQFVSEHCCYGKLPAQEMTIKDINPSNSYHYSLESFCESRATEWKFEPYRGQPIDSPVNGVAPQPWDINVQPREMFADHKTKLEVPHTANIKPCHDCKAVGYIQCDVCCGDGSVRFQHSNTALRDCNIFEHAASVFPITNFFEQQINISSKKLVEEHARKWPSKRILLQRQVLRAVPVSEVFYEWKETSSRYWVFGLDHQVYAPDYPQKCCCGCSIL
ncbi:PREDICTED: protein SSUH2 homolog, partial [Acropora digitifera]|uniref:protein SSUH2 homolog n=1 Tax=Acropora digitifera TaxID=70779 RepID=UPI00077AC829